MKTTLMKMTWWCLASPGAAPRAVVVDSRESEPRRQGGMYGTLVERASTTCERVHRWLTPLKEVQAASAPRSTEVVDQSLSPSERPWGTQIQRTPCDFEGKPTGPRTADLCARESRHPSRLDGSSLVRQS